MEVLKRLHVHFSANIPISPSKSAVMLPVSSSGSLMSPKGKKPEYVDIERILNSLREITVS